MTGRILIDTVRDGVARIHIDNPGKYNAMSLAMWLELDQQVQKLGDSPDVRVLVLAGTGDKAFVSGADISEFDTTRTAETGSERYDQAVEAAQHSLANAPFPVVAAIRGVCMGGGLGLAMACDLRYATDDSSFRMPAARLGLGYSYMGMRQMVHAIGAARTAELFYTARKFDGTEAARIDVVHQSWPREQFEQQLEERLRQVSENAPLTLRLAKAAIALVSAGDGDGSAAIEMERARQRCTRSEDYAEGRAAFAQKRAPRFLGR
ncbi:enoyl-CoA hydratase [Xenophilus aerolatus]|nr:enoyl-CoA hydratase [Xenophilus aerolatus]